MANTFRKIYKKTGSSGTSSDYQLVGNIGVDGVELDIMKGATSGANGEIGLVPKPTAGQDKYVLQGNGIWTAPNSIIEASDTIVDMKSDLNQVVNYTGDSFTAYQGITINKQYTWGARWGYIGTIHIRFNTPSSVSGLNYDLRAIQLPTSLYPANSGYPMMYEAWGSGTGTQFFIAGADLGEEVASGHIRMVERVKANTDYFICYSFVIASGDINKFF